MWTDDWIGLPYQELGRGPETYDCLGLVLALQRERHGRDLFDPLCPMTVAARMDVAARMRRDWRPVETPIEGAVLSFRVRGYELHVGYALGGRLMLHTSQETGESLIEDFRSANWGDRLEGIYVYGG